MYLKKQLQTKDLDNMRIALSTRQEKLSPDPVCDFCGETPIWVYASSRMSTGETRECWRWCACESCSALADGANWEQLTERIVARLRKMVVGPVPTYQLREAASLALREFVDYATRDLVTA